MVNKVFLNDFALTVSNFKEEKVKSKKSEKLLTVVSFEFKVRGGEEYHVVTKFLYENIFDVSIPDKSLEFRGKLISIPPPIPISLMKTVLVISL
ncbi:DUF3219 family protein [Niallia circulans]